MKKLSIIKKKILILCWNDDQYVADYDISDDFNNLEFYSQFTITVISGRFMMTLKRYS